MKCIFGLTLVIVSCVAFGQSSCHQPSGTGIGNEGVDGINLVTTGSGIATSTLIAGMNQWNNCTDQYVPNFTLNGTNHQGAEITVEIISGNAPRSHVGEWSIGNQRLTLWTHNNNGDALTADQLRYIFVHELGHVLGLADSSCNVMNSNYSASTPDVEADDCSYVSSGWRDRFLSCQKLVFLVFQTVSYFHHVQ